VPTSRHCELWPSPCGAAILLCGEPKTGRYQCLENAPNAMRSPISWSFPFVHVTRTRLGLFRFFSFCVTSAEPSSVLRWTQSGRRRSWQASCDRSEKDRRRPISASAFGCPGCVHCQGIRARLLSARSMKLSWRALRSRTEQLRMTRSSSNGRRWTHSNSFRWTAGRARAQEVTEEPDLCDPQVHRGPTTRQARCEANRGDGSAGHELVDLRVRPDNAGKR
jgi:hypothetical protein